IGSAALLTLYLGIISLAQGVEHAFEQLALDAPFVGLIALGFGIQVGLFTELRAVDRHHRAAAAVTAAGTGTSTAAMLACCAHHLVDVLPIVGLSAASVFLNAYKTPLFVVGIAMNLIGIVVIGRQLQQARRACAIVASLASEHGADGLGQFGRAEAGGRIAPERQHEEVVKMADTVKDPVCGMEIRPENAAATEVHDGQTFYFCSEACHRTFAKDPHRYGHVREEHGGHAGHAGHAGHGGH
ncbi:MAG TPA: YHS domain-containing protein, partial [Vicinamibacterales bacterium]|nr:YHS domain-containing protein [Vicinamibacterales bacterium]